jgi:hypothetical protein
LATRPSVARATRFQIHKAQEAQYCKALFFAPHGHGKTYLLATADDDERSAPSLFLDFEGGTQTIVGRDIDVGTIRDWNDYSEAYALLSAKGCKYRSVGIDSISETQVAGILEILDKDAKRTDPDLMAQQDWGVILVQMRRFIRHFRDLPMHVFMSALAGETVEPRVGTIRAPLLQGAFQKELPGIMDVVGYLANEDMEEGIKRYLLLHSYPKYQVKARTPYGMTIPSEIEDPTVGRLLDVLGYTA